MSLRRLTWSAYLLMVCEGYLVYIVGYLTPYLQSELGAPPWVAALPNSAMAVGLLVSGFLVNRVVRRLGPGPAIRLWIGVMATSGVLMSLAVSVWPIVAGAFLLGVSIAGVLVHIITALADRSSGLYLTRAILWSVVGGVLGPIAVSTAARTIGWNFAVAIPVPFLVALIAVVPASPARDQPNPDGAQDAALGRAYWLTWFYLVLGISAEFSFVAWGAQVAVDQARIRLEDATALASLFVVGEILGRLGLSTVAGTRLDVRRVLQAGTVLAAAGGLLLWLAGTPVLAGAGMFLGGLGIAAIFPLGAGLAVAHAPHAQVRASTRLTAASGSAILGAPLLLGVVAGIAGVISAWAFVLAFLAAAVVMISIVPRVAPSTARTSAAGVA
jgi:MFS family permease